MGGRGLDPVRITVYEEAVERRQGFKVEIDGVFLSIDERM
jgi:hypothetical protein